ncbi:hypothetical protein B4098_0427 [Heyndrickxia coagulans]|uniref:Uncharacterized protein n=1 Tax=Heyndrickxia coagulans TaxID=1398 RepID=A0A150K100_HEYCO|nr:hypothetical protein B4098_0427 [Heyndrickxia coagulans]
MLSERQAERYESRVQNRSAPPLFYCKFSGGGPAGMYVLVFLQVTLSLYYTLSTY